MDSEVRAALAAAGGVLSRRDHPLIARRLERAVASGGLESPLPGVCALLGVMSNPESRIAAGVVWAGPDAIVCSEAAARLTFWPGCRVDRVELAVRRHARSGRRGWSEQTRVVPDELVVMCGTLRLTSPALTALDLCTGPAGGDVIDRVLRTRSATLDQLWHALRLTPGRRGNLVRTALLEDSRDEPWSEAERFLHRLLRAAQITNWRTNVWIGDEGGGFFADVLFQRAKVILEVDGWEFHSSRRSFEDDRRRRNALVLAGYLVLNFTWRQILDDPGWVLDCIARAVGISLQSRSENQPSARKM